MTSCQNVATFLQQVSSKSVTSRLPDPDVATLQQLGLLQRLSSDQYQALTQQVASLQQSLAGGTDDESEQRAQAAAQAQKDSKKTHSILFHLEGVDKQKAQLERLQSEQDAVKTLDDDLAKRQQEFAQLLVSRSTLDTCTAYNGGYVAVTSQGRVALRDLNVRLYRVSDLDFAAYWKQMAQIDAELTNIAALSAATEGPLASRLSDVDPSYVWAVSIGMAKSGRDAGQLANNFLAAYQGIDNFSPNPENRLMAAEVLSALPRPVEESVPMVKDLNKTVRKLDVPPESSLGVASILLMGQRQDGSFATEELQSFLGATQSYEGAALLSVVNRPQTELSQRFETVRGLFAGWGVDRSEDTELSSAYLAASELPLESVGPKLAILSHGLGGYLEYPMVGSAVLASIPVLEANETLNLLERAYEALGRRTGPISQAELICLAIRMVHGIQVPSVDELDPTAKVQPMAPPTFTYARMPMMYWMPVFIVHGSYYSTYSGLGGPHPGHVHTWGGGGFTGGGFTG